MADHPKLKAKDAPDLGRFNWEDAFRLEDQLEEWSEMEQEALSRKAVQLRRA